MELALALTLSVIRRLWLVCGCCFPRTEPSPDTIVPPAADALLSSSVSPPLRDTPAHMHVVEPFD